jgi:hypothetical protein
MALCGLAAIASTGCQSTVGGQTMPSAYFLTDDVQFFPAGPEGQLTNQIQKLDEYRLEQEAIDGGLEP